ncbi:acyl-CoA dehydrogenase C-terminal domain-containing protein [Teredinibacter turnerae]|uniref:acyl-CoA dehydrogenase C-terminal domain-containing protein n=1 Tax=Teredinibacter turnerae TaxID=2426 RepID=UPI0003613708|nr:acyl-CoA dehydrogenase C-terminal domain-containing protein [Teredinibacter turnerae]
MPDYKAPLDDIRFVIERQLATYELWHSLRNFEDLDKNTVEAILSECGKIAGDAIAPCSREADEQGCQLQDGKVAVPQGFADAYQLLCDGGWCSLSGNPEFGGMGLPKSLVAAVDEMVQGACMSFGLLPMLTAGACLAIDAHGSDALKSTYLEKMYSGAWSGAMDLTEPHAGTDLGLIRTRAEPLDDGSYAVTGTKIFITWGEHQLVENIIHLVLAKLPDAPTGSRGISMFLVPKYIPDAQGEPGERNRFSCGGLEKKMGIKASPTCVMNFDGARGWLVGEPHKGLQAMFTMMNYERLVVGIQGVGAAEASYQNAVSYARERLQGRSPGGAHSPEKEADNLLVHPDVRRMLLTMRALNEAGRAFYIYVSQWLDIAKFSDDQQRKTQAEALVALLTPVAKGFMTDRAFEVAVLGQQVYGGHGFIREWGQEQLVRDTRITQIYEGTNGVQAMDLVGRKTVATHGQLLDVFVGDVDAFVAGLVNKRELSNLITPLQQAIVLLQTTTHSIVQQSADNRFLPGAVAVDYQDMVGYVCYAYMWLRAAAAVRGDDSDFACAKRATAEFYMLKLLPQVDTLARRVVAGSAPVMAMRDDWF